MEITLCVEENKIECKESGSDIKLQKIENKKSSVERNQNKI